jgi:hypothetical protein
MIAGDWLGLTHVFQDVGFTPKAGWSFRTKLALTLNFLLRLILHTC